MVIAIDGPGGVGKSTVAQAVANARGMAYLDTGATYRAAAVAAMRAGTDLDDPEAVLAAVARADIAYEGGCVSVDGVDVTDLIRTPAITAASSVIAAYPAVRSVVVAIQQEWVEAHGSAVVEGRDIGTVVFPEAAVKVFLTARPDVRASRRAIQAGDDDAVDEVRKALDERDRADSTRDTSPLRAAEDAVVIDTSEMSLGDVITLVVELVDQDRNRRRPM